MSMKIIFRGVVQGVGFRPTVYRIAIDMGLNGYVLNKGSEVEVVVDKKEEEFIEELKKELPKIARIDEIIIENYEEKFKGFKILHSEDGERSFSIPVDTAICNDCLKEIFDPGNKRYHYPFTNCTVCGARFSIIKDLPYDRCNTSMDKFKMCNDCMDEYSNPSNRRYHAQTISCPECGPFYTLYDKNKKTIAERDDAIKKFAGYVDDGAIGIIKSWGGMHISCKIEEIKKFREWYMRYQKPFAIMVRDIKTAMKYAYITKEEEKILLSNERPILLLNKRNNKLEEASPCLSTIGIYLPYSGVHHLLFSYMNSDALIMTSANIAGEPMIVDNEKAFSLGADFYLLHNRDIINRVDDSVIKLWKGRKFFIRRSRGFIPYFIKSNHSKRIISVGAEENVCGAISYNKKIYSTQYIGNTKYYPTLEFLYESLKFLMKLMKIKEIDAVAMDMHPRYATKRIAEKIANEYDVKTIEIQHHWAHATSLLLENNLEEAIVITLDGLGYGSDGNLWGGEVLYASYNKFERLGHLKELPLIGGDKAAKDVRRLVFAIFKKWNKSIYFHGMEEEILSKAMEKAPLSTSMGRLLDALSCYLGICNYRSYEGEPAMKLEKYLEMGENRYEFDLKVKNGVVDTIYLFKQLVDVAKNKKLNEKEKSDLAYSFVKSVMKGLTNMAIKNAIDRDIKNIGISGGVSYNIPITEMVEEEVKKAGLNFITHNIIPNGDGGVAMGQNAIAGSLMEEQNA